jgi:glucose/arabinose dehydrogenase
MLDVRVSPETSAQPKIYLTYTTRTGSLVGTALGLGTLAGNNLSNYRQIFSVNPGVSSGNQFGSRIEFDNAGHVFITTGDHGHRDLAQDLDSHIGKIIRLNLDGSVPADNPFVNTAHAKKEIWSLGLRSPEGLTRNPATGDLWESEMGPLGGDEVNLVKRGANYGWPVICWGLEYSGEPVGAGLHEKEGMEQPLVYWIDTPKEDHISPAALTFYTGDAFPKWKGNVFVGTLSSTHLRRLVVRGNQVVEQEVLLKDLGLRIRNVRSGPDGLLYLSTDSGLIARLVPAN